MIDLGLLRESPEAIIGLLKKKDPAFDAQRLFDLDKQVSTLRQEVESLRHEKNELAKKGRAGVTPELREQSIILSKRLKVQELALAEGEKTIS